MVGVIYVLGSKEYMVTCFSILRKVMKLDTEKKIIVFSLLVWIIFAIIIPVFTGFGKLSAGLDQTNYLALLTTILTIFGCAYGLILSNNLTLCRKRLIKILAAILIIPSGVFFVGNTIVIFFNLHSDINPFRLVPVCTYLISFFLGVCLLLKMKNIMRTET